MEKNNLSTIIDFGSTNLRLGVFDEKLSNLFFKTKEVNQNDNFENYVKSINLIIREAEKKISTHLENITVLYDNPEICSVDICIKKKLDHMANFNENILSMILEANNLINNHYQNKKIIHLIIKKYIINDKEFFNIPDEIPKLDSLILEIKLILLPYSRYKNVIEIFNKNNLKVLNFFSSSLVKSFQYIELFQETKFVAFLDIGLDRSTLIFFNNKKIDFLNNIPIGGNHISKDISQIMKLKFDDSENLKKTFSKSETDFTYSDTVSSDSNYTINKIIGKNISIDLLKKVVLARVEEIIKLSFKDLSILKNIDSYQDLNFVLIGNGSKIFNKNSFQLEDKYNFKEINFYEENDLEICIAGLKYEKNFNEKNVKKFKKNQKKIGFFHKFFNFFGNR
tara:strand:+ start:970 stop:2154 length:1185 start_codon:yes stop_codon:yes gene_type:complete